MIETEFPADEHFVMSEAVRLFGLNDAEIKGIFEMKHFLTHRIIYARLYLLIPGEVKSSEISNIFEVEFESLKSRYSLPRLLTRFLEKREVINILNDVGK